MQARHLPPLERSRNLGRSAARKGVEAGSLAVVRRGVLVRTDDPTKPGTLIPQVPRHVLREAEALREARAVSMSHGPSLVFVRETAALLLGAWVHEAELPIHVWLPSNVSTVAGRDPQVRRHRFGLLEGDVRLHDDVFVTSAERTLVQCAAAMSFVQGAIVVDSLLRLGADKAIARKMIESAPGARGIRQARRLVELCEGKADSVPEIMVHALAALNDLPRLAQQLRVTVDGEPFDLDLGLQQRKIGIEIDGAVKFAGLKPSQLTVKLHEAMRRHSVLTSAGWAILRLRWADLADHDRLVVRLNRLIWARAV